MREYERRGVAGLHIEDQGFPLVAVTSIGIRGNSTADANRPALSAILDMVTSP
jgi:hypothetical protein